MSQAVRLFCVILFARLVTSVWTDFDLVRPFYGAWGSEGIIPYIKIDSRNNNGPNVTENANFGFSMAVVGDLDGNGVDDLAVGATGESVFRDGSKMINAGGVYILFMLKNGTVDKSVRIGSMLNGGPLLSTDDRFGYSIAALGDLDGDSVPDIAVGAPGVILSSVYILYLRANGTAKARTLIRGPFAGTVPANVSNPSIPVYVPNGPTIRYGSQLGYAVAAVGDMNGDGITEIAASSIDQSGGLSRVYIMFMHRNGSVMNYTTIGSGIGGGPVLDRVFTGFGSALLMLPDFDGDGIAELVVGAKFLFDAGSENVRAGKAFFCFMAANGTVKSSQEIGELSLGVDQPMPSLVRNLVNCAVFICAYTV